MKLNILVLLIADLPMALRYIVVEISILPIVFFFPHLRLRLYVQCNFLAIKKSKHVTSTRMNVQIRVGCHPVIRSIIADYDCNLFLMRANTCHMLQCLLPNLEQKFWLYSFLQLLSRLLVYHIYCVLGFVHGLALKKQKKKGHIQPIMKIL